MSDTGHPAIRSEKFGQTLDGESVTLYTLTNKSGSSVSLMDYGATVVRIKVPDKEGRFDDVVLGFDEFAPYPGKSPYFGATVGRFGNRIARGKFSLDGREYAVSINDGPHSLHGGQAGFNKRRWSAQPADGPTPAITFRLVSKDGDQGYPGNLHVTVTYRWTNQSELEIRYHATTDQATVLNLTNHTYFNLAGSKDATILNHELKLNARAFTPVDATLIPTGKIEPVKGTPWDFTSPRKIGARLQETGGNPIGYDHNFVLDKDGVDDSLAAVVAEPITGRVLTVHTEQPGVQFYSGNFLDGTVTGKSGRAYPQYGGFCLETQHFPDSPNQPSFPSTVLRPGETFRSITTLAFSVR